MKIVFSISLLILVILTSLSINMPIHSVEASTEQQIPTYQYAYYSNGSLTNFDVQNLNSILPGYIYISFVENNLIYYNNFSTSYDVIGRSQLYPSDFFLFTVNNYMNSSITITGSQYILNQDFNVFAVYFTYNGNFYCYVFVTTPYSNALLNVKLFSGIQYYKSNSLFTFLGSVMTYFEFRTNESFVIYGINNTDFSFSKQFESKIINNSSSSFDISDVHFVNQTLYLIYNDNPFSVNGVSNSTVYGFYMEGNTLSYTSIFFKTFISSIAIYRNYLFALNRYSNTIDVLDLGAQQIIYILKSGITDNFTIIRAFNTQSFLLQDIQDNLIYCFLNGNTLNTNATSYLALTETHPQSYSVNDPQIVNNEYTFALFPNSHYFVAGYLFNPLNKTEKNGFGLTLQSVGTKPSIFIDSSKTVAISYTFSSTGSSAPSVINTFPIAVIAFLIIIVGVVVFAYFSVKKGNAEKPAKKIQANKIVKTSKEIPNGRVCFKCGSEVYENDVFCQNCGNKL